MANSLVLVSDDLCLLRYGIVDEETTSLAVTVEPNEYGMEAGLFVGLRDVKIGELRQFQRIGIVLTDDDRLWLRQAIQDFHPRSPSSRNTHPKPSQTFPSQTAVHRLFVGMKKGQVTRITLDDVELDMTTPFLEADASALGVFGVFVTEKSAKFSDFELDNNLQTLIDD